MWNRQDEEFLVPQELVRRFRTDFLTYLPARLGPAAVGMATVMILTRLFPPVEYGRYTLVLAGGGIALVVLGGWLRECALRFFPGERMKGAEDALLDVLLTMALATAALPLVAVCVVLVLRGALASYRDLLPWAGAWVVLGLLYAPLSSSLQAGLQARRYALWEALRAALGLILMILYVFLVRRYVGGAFAGTAVSTLIVGLFIARGLRVIPRGRSARSTHLKTMVRPAELLEYGLPLVGWALGLEALNLADRFILNWFHGSGTVGIYASSYYLADGGTALLMMPLLAAAKPLIMHASSTGQPGDVQRLVTSASRVLLLLLLPCLAATAVLSQRIALVFLDPAYVQGYVVLPLVVAGVGVWSLGQLGHTSLQLARRTKTMLAGVLGCAAVNVALNMVAVPRWSYRGAAATTLISYSLYPLFVYWMSRGSLRWRIPWATVGRSAAAAAVMGVSLAAIWSRWTDSLASRLALSCLAPVVYVGLLFFLGELSRDDWRHAWAWLARRLRMGRGLGPR